MAVLRVSIIFFIGCFVLITNASLSFLPFIGLKSHLPKSLIYVEGILSVISCSLFLIGSGIAFWESWKASAGLGGYFGWELEDYSPVDSKESWAEKGESKEAIDEQFDEETTEEKLDEKQTEDELDEKKSEAVAEAPPPAHQLFKVYQHSTHSEHFHHYLQDLGLEEGKLVIPQTPETPPPPYEDHHTWKHVTSAHGFHEIYCNLGLIASAIFLVCSLLYCITALASLVTILSTGEVYRAIRYPQLVGGTGFTIGSLLLLIKCQKDTTGHWWKPALRKLAWHVNVWNLIGSAGFVFCAYFGLLAHVHWSDFQFNCSYLWGSWAFLLGAMIQWYKARHKMKRFNRMKDHLKERLEWK